MNEIEFFIEQLNKFEKYPDFALENKEFNKLSVRINQFINNNEIFRDTYIKRALYFERLYNYDFACDNPLLGGLSILRKNLIQANQYCIEFPENYLLEEDHIKQIFSNMEKLIRIGLIDLNISSYKELNCALNEYFEFIDDWLSIIKDYGDNLEKYKYLDIDEEIVIDVDKFNKMLFEIEDAYVFYKERLWTVPVNEYVKEFMVFSQFLEGRLNLESEDVKSVAELIKLIFKILQIESNKLIERQDDPLEATSKGNNQNLIDNKEVKHNLSPTEINVLDLWQTKTMQEIADLRFVTHETIKTHTKNIKQKLKVKSKTDAILKGIKLGIIENPQNSG